jgi:hypothetical protein
VLTLRWPLVEVVAPRPPGLVTLEGRRQDGRWLPTACVPPCALRLDPTLEYRVAGDGVSDSDPFQIPLGPARVKVDVAAGSSVLRTLGSVFMVGGVVFAAGGGAVLLYPGDSHASNDDKTSKLAAGVGVLTMGVLVAAVGVLVHYLNGTSARVQPEAP